MKKWVSLIGNKDLARVVGDLCGDGHLQIQDWRYLVSFYSNNEDLSNGFKKRMENLFGIKSRLYLRERFGKIQYRLFFISKPLSLFLYSVGVPKGNKVNQPFFVPEWIMKGSKKVKSSYLRGLYDSEGSVFYSKKKNGGKRWRISFHMHKLDKFQKEGEVFFNQLRLLLSELSIKSSPLRVWKCNKRKDGTETISLKIEIEFKEFGNFYKYVGFDDKDKKRKLEIALQRWPSG